MSAAGIGLVDAAELELVQREDDDEEGSDDADGDHGGAPQKTSVAPRLAAGRADGKPRLG
jgi:hypothetical protein